MEESHPLESIVFIKEFLELFYKYGYKIVETDIISEPYKLYYKNPPKDLENDVTRGLLVFDNIHEIKFYIALLEKAFKQQLN
jgi:hypothetical protein